MSIICTAYTCESSYILVSFHSQKIYHLHAVNRITELFFLLVSTYRNSYYEESRQGLYSGPLFLFAYWLFSVPFSIISTIVASFIVFQWVKNYFISNFNRAINRKTIIYYTMSFQYFNGTNLYQ